MTKQQSAPRRTVPEVRMKLVEKAETKQAKGDTNAQHNAQTAPDSNASKPAGKGPRQEIIKKSPVKANVESYDQLYSSFDWEDAKKELSYFAGGKLNAGYNAIDRHLHNGRK